MWAAETKLGWRKDVYIKILQVRKRGLGRLSK